MDLLRNFANTAKNILRQPLTMAMIAGASFLSTNEAKAQQGGKLHEIPMQRPDQMHDPRNFFFSFGYAQNQSNNEYYKGGSLQVKARVPITNSRGPLVLKAEGGYEYFFRDPNGFSVSAHSPYGSAVYSHVPSHAAVLFLVGTPEKYRFHVDIGAGPEAYFGSQINALEYANFMGLTEVGVDLMKGSSPVKINIFAGCKYVHFNHNWFNYVPPNEEEAVSGFIGARLKIN